MSYEMSSKYFCIGFLLQHFTWHRFISLLIGGVLMYMAKRWELTQYLAALQRPAPQAPAQGPAAAVPDPAAPLREPGGAPEQPVGGEGVTTPPRQAAPQAR
jgi:hypothetical protein